MRGGYQKKEKKDFAYYVLKAQSDNKMVFNTRNIENPNIYKFFENFTTPMDILYFGLSILSICVGYYLINRK